MRVHKMDARQFIGEKSHGNPQFIIKPYINQAEVGEWVKAWQMMVKHLRNISGRKKYVKDYDNQ